MARKANIAREEIHQACWALLETNHFPNIPRVADFFLNKDGRRCSNTTLMNAIAEWEELYREHQQHQLKELDDSLHPAFHRFSRDVTQVLGQLLDEKTHDAESQHALKQQAVEGQYLSLTYTLCELQSNFDLLSEDHNQLEKQYNEALAKLSHSQQRYQEVLSQNTVLNSQIERSQTEKNELRINLAQHEVDLAKLDNKTQSLEEENLSLKGRLKQLEEEKGCLEKQQFQYFNQKLQEISESMQQFADKDRGRNK